uniref:Queuosine 5'-phosphate N-glycosylase/hydrolase n=1 Tax=Panagrellus redivivus TaxID=6233 RepID=A0A7E4UYP1_PANRE
MTVGNSFYEKSNIPKIIGELKHVSFGPNERFRETAVELGRILKLGDSQELVDQLVSPPDSLTTPEKFNWFFLMDLINFHFFYDNYDPYVVKLQDKSYVGSMAGAAAINRWLLQHSSRVIAPLFLGLARPEFIKDIFKAENGEDIPLIEERIKMIHETYTNMLNLKTNFYEASLNRKFDPKAMVDFLVTNFEHFRDFGQFGSTQIAFHKRAQLLVKDVLTNCAADIKQLGFTIKMDYLSVFADYRIPQVLRHYGLIKYTDELNSAIAAGPLTDPTMEVEIRAITLAACDRLSQIMGIPSAELDTLLWKKRRVIGPSLDERYPFHRYRTTAY